MADFISDFWSWYIIVPVVLGLLYCVFLIVVNTTAPKSGEAETMGHTWDEDLQEYNNPLPKWWLNMFYITLIFGAVYLDAGFDPARRVIEKAYGARLEDFPDIDELRDPKTRLQEWMQARQKGLPEYELLDVAGKAHRQVFRASCRVQERTTTGTGSTRRNAEQQAAERMLDQLTGGAAS